MFKRLLLALVLLLFVSSAYSDISVLEPVKADVADEGILELGSVSCGETIEIIVKRRFGDFYWDKIVEEQSSVPAGWSFSWEQQRDSLIILVSVPENAVESTQLLKIGLSSDEDIFAPAFLNARVSVKKQLLSVDMVNLSQETMVGAPTKFGLSVSNNSIADHRLFVSSTLPSYWFEDIVLEIPAMDTTVFELELVPRSYGPREFSFRIESKLNDFSKMFDAKLLVFQTLSGKYTSVFYGFPFFNISLLPYYFVNSFLALVS